jgi:hypothetical protein
VIPDPKREEHLSPRQSHGLKALKRAVKTLGSRTIDRHTHVGKALPAVWCEEPARDLGGEDALSTAQRARIEQPATMQLFLDSIDGRRATQPTLPPATPHMAPRRGVPPILILTPSNTRRVFFAGRALC